MHGIRHCPAWDIQYNTDQNACRIFCPKRQEEKMSEKESRKRWLWKFYINILSGRQSMSCSYRYRYVYPELWFQSRYIYHVFARHLPKGRWFCWILSMFWGGGGRSDFFLIIFFKLTGVSFQLCSSLVLSKILSKCTLPNVWGRQTSEIEKNKCWNCLLLFHSFLPFSMFHCCT